MKKSMFVKLASVIAILAVFVTPVMFPNAKEAYSWRKKAPMDFI